MHRNAAIQVFLDVIFAGSCSCCRTRGWRSSSSTCRGGHFQVNKKPNFLPRYNIVAIFAYNPLHWKECPPPLVLTNV